MIVHSEKSGFRLGNSKGNFARFEVAGWKAPQAFNGVFRDTPLLRSVLSFSSAARHQGGGAGKKGAWDQREDDRMWSGGDPERDGILFAGPLESRKQPGFNYGEIFYT